MSPSILAVPYEHCATIVNILGDNWDKFKIKSFCKNFEGSEFSSVRFQGLRSEFLGSAFSWHHRFHMSYTVQDAIVWDMKRKGNVISIAFHKFVSRIGVQSTLKHAAWNSKWVLVFFPRCNSWQKNDNNDNDEKKVANVGYSTNLSANQASYTLMIS